MSEKPRLWCSSWMSLQSVLFGKPNASDLGEARMDALDLRLAGQARCASRLASRSAALPLDLGHPVLKVCSIEQHRLRSGSAGCAVWLAHSSCWLLCDLLCAPPLVLPVALVGSSNKE